MSEKFDFCLGYRPGRKEKGPELRVEKQGKEMFLSLAFFCRSFDSGLAGGEFLRRVWRMPLRRAERFRNKSRSGRI